MGMQPIDENKSGVSEKPKMPVWDKKKQSLQLQDLRRESAKSKERKVKMASGVCSRCGFDQCTVVLFARPVPGWACDYKRDGSPIDKTVMGCWSECAKCKYGASSIEFDSIANQGGRYGATIESPDALQAAFVRSSHCSVKLFRAAKPKDPEAKAKDEDSSDSDEEDPVYNELLMAFPPQKLVNVEEPCFGVQIQGKMGSVYSFLEETIAAVVANGQASEKAGNKQEIQSLMVVAHALTNFRDGKEAFRIEIDDPSGNSYVETSEELTEYNRTAEQNAKLGYDVSKLLFRREMATKEDKIKMAKWEQAKLKEWETEGSKLRKRFELRAAFDAWVEKQCTKALKAKFAASGKKN